MLASDEKTQGCHGNRIIVYKIILYFINTGAYMFIIAHMAQKNYF